MKKNGKDRKNGFGRLFSEFFGKNLLLQENAAEELSTEEFPLLPLN
jgi:hypothetical protein